MFGKFEKPQAFFETGVRLSELMGDFDNHQNFSQIPEIQRKSVKYPSFIQFWLNVPDTNKSYQFTPTKKLIDAVESSMIACEYDRIYFSVIMRNNDTFDLYATYNLIIGSRFLGNFELSELPK